MAGVKRQTLRKYSTAVTGRLKLPDDGNLLLFMSRRSLIVGKRPWYLHLRGKLFALQRNALRAPDQFEIPPNRVIELSIRRDLMLTPSFIVKDA